MSLINQSWIKNSSNMWWTLAMCWVVGDSSVEVLRKPTVTVWKVDDGWDEVPWNKSWTPSRIPLGPIHHLPCCTWGLRKSPNLTPFSYKPVTLLYLSLFYYNLFFFFIFILHGFAEVSVRLKGIAVLDGTPVFLNLSTLLLIYLISFCKNKGKLNFNLNNLFLEWQLFS